jgi:hypothetical protein
MPELDLVLRGGTLCTAAEQARADLGILDGTIVLHCGPAGAP